MPHRCAFGCKDTHVVMHTFPNPDKFPERFKAWVNLVGDNLGMCSNKEIYLKKRICDIHFTYEHRNRYKRLNALAVPSLFLPDLSTMKPLYNCAQLRSLQTKIRYLRTEVCRLRKKGQLYKDRLANAEKLSNNMAFKLVTKNVKRPAQLFAHMQLQTKNRPKGRRFNIEEKVLALSMFKKSPKCYRLLCSYFTLPSTKTLKKLLSLITLKPGINPIIFEKIKKTVTKKDKGDRLCSLIFDEMSITPHVQHNAQNDELEGFVSNQKCILADHALVFMVKGVKRNIKQPIAYFFTHKLKKIELKALIKSVVKHALNAGLIIVNTVCDQSPVNVSAINELINDTKAIYLRKGKEWRHDMFHIKGHNIIPIFDTPHLIKGLRNNLLTKDMLYITAIKKK